jgi:hypothetical protein
MAKCIYCGEQTQTAFFEDDPPVCMVCAAMIDAGLEPIRRKPQSETVQKPGKISASGA